MRPGVTDLKGPVACIGECMVEFADRGAAGWQRGFAGDTLNVAWALRALVPASETVQVITRVGGDEISDAMVAFFRSAGLDTTAVQRDPARTVGLYTIATKDGERSFSYWRSASAARHMADNADELAASVKSAGAIYLSGITAAILGEAGRDTLLAVLRDAKSGGAVIAYDPNYRPVLWESVEAMRAFSTRIATMADILTPTFDDEAAAFGDADPDATVARLVAAGCSEIVVKDGPLPTTLALAGNSQKLAPANIVQPIDTTGAGDSFNGAYLAARLSGQTPENAVRQAQAISARVILERGAIVAPDELRAVLT